MPASGGDPIGTALRFGFSTNSKQIGNIDNGLEVSAKRILHTQIKMEPATPFKTIALASLKAKYTVINTKSAPVNEKSNGGNSASKKTEAALPVPKAVLFPNENVQLGFRSSMPVGSGMINLGNTCYLNATLQALFHVPAFVNWLLNEPAHQKCEQNLENPIHVEDITCAVVKTLKCSQSKTGGFMKPTCIFYKLKAICRHFSQGSQEDAHEFMRYLLESLEKGFLSKISGIELESWSKETTPINQIFGGYIRSEVSCLQCHAVSTTFQHFQDLPLDIRKASALNEALAGYFAREKLPGGDDAYKCEKCCRKVEATKRFSVERPPNVLCIQLKRFNTMNGKLTKQVELPRLLDLSPYLSSAVQPRHAVLYRLVGMVTHMGQSANCGHYTAIALAANGNYYQFDDTSVRQVAINAVQNMSAYLILYELERPFHINNPRRTPASETSAQRESESASTGGSEAKEPRRSPTAACQAPHASSTSALTSLVAYESDDDSDADIHKKDDTRWKESSTLKQTVLSTGSWRVTDLKRKCSPDTMNSGPLKNATNGPRENVNKSNNLISFEKAPLENGDVKRSNVVNELLQNSHLGYGYNQIRTWDGASNNLDRQINEERKEGRKRTYDESYNAEFDRGKGKKRYFKGPKDVRRYDSNPFQRRANDYNRAPKNYNNNFRFRNNWNRRPFNKNHHRSYNSYY